MGPLGLPLFFLFLFLFFLSTGCALFPITLPMGTIKFPLGVGPFPSLLPNICSLPPVSGSCLALLKRWYYDSELRQCVEFDYGGCGGNLNNFLTQGAASGPVPPQVQSGLAPVRPPQPSRTRLVAGTVPRTTVAREPSAAVRLDAGGSATCLQEPSVATAPGGTPRPPPIRLPDQLPPGHRLRSQLPGRKCCRYGCLESCVLPVEEHPGTCPKMPVLQTFVPCNHTCTDDRQCPPEEKCCYDGCGRSCLPPVRRSRCQLPAEPGPCQVLQPRYFYSPNHGRCQVFFYGGCQGNANNFRSRSECHRVCSRSQPDSIFD